MATALPPNTSKSVTCPFCGLACDDLVASVRDPVFQIDTRGCETAAASFRRLSAPIDNASPRLNGKPVTLAAAARAVADLLRLARQPLFAGLALDLAASRAALALAEASGGILDHMNSPAKLRNFLTLQSEGWITTTLTEARNRADFFLMVGGDLTSRFPRFADRILWPGDALEPERLAGRRLAYLGETKGGHAISTPNGHQPLMVRCDNRALPEVLGALRAVLDGSPVRQAMVAGVSIAILQELARRLKSAQYGVIAWSAADFDFPHGELAVGTLAGLLKDLNRTTRCAGLPLGGSQGDFTFNGVHLWQTGFPFRTALGATAPDYDPHRYSAIQTLADGTVDALIWLSSLDDQRQPPKTALPSVVLAPPSLRLDLEPRIFVPVATPGIHHSGHFFRGDKVVALPLRSLTGTTLPSAKVVIDLVLEAMGVGPPVN